MKINMKIKLKAHLPISKQLSSHIGDMTLKNYEIVKFEKTENFHIIDYLNDEIFPIKRSEIEVQFLDEFDEDFNRFNVFIKIKNSLKIGVKLNWFEKIKLKWILKKYRIQNPENQWKVIIFITATILTIISLIYRVTKK